MLRRNKSTTGVSSITAVAPSREDEIDRRARRYIWSMLFRSACLVGAFAADGWLRWTLVVISVFMPWIAVVMGNQRSGHREIHPNFDVKTLGERDG